LLLAIGSGNTDFQASSSGGGGNGRYVREAKFSASAPASDAGVPENDRASAAREDPTIRLIHHVNLDALAQGDASVLLHYAASVWTWQYVAERLSLAQAEMQPQLALVERLIASAEASGRLTLNVTDYIVACDGAAIMDMLAAGVDAATAVWAADRSNAEAHRRFAKAVFDARGKSS
jgi:hypothetical protein